MLLFQSFYSSLLVLQTVKLECLPLARLSNQVLCVTYPYVLHSGSI
jgi:hypothetical protein